MLLKTATSLAFGAACLTALSTLPAQAQMGGPAPAYSGPQTYQGNMPSSSAATGGAEVVTNGPQTSPGDTSTSWSARRNVIESQQYDRLLETNRAFREARMRKECGPIADAELHQQCLASFRQDTPYTGSSVPSRSTRSDYGR
jgi:hypothetical protein